MLWISVLEDAIWIIMQKPAGTNSAQESHMEREKENSSSAVPKPAQETATQTLSPLRVFLIASVSAPTNAPAPEQPISSPRALAPPCRIWAAKTGMSTA